MLILLTICHVVLGTCKEEQVYAPDAPANPAMCLHGAQPTIAEYMQSFPNWRVERTRCLSKADMNRMGQPT